MNERLSLPVSCWPSIDQELWAAAHAPMRFLEKSRPASKWSPRRRRIVEQAYGQWLAWLQAGGNLNPAQSPGERVNPQLMGAFIDQLTDRVAPWSVAMMIGAVKRVLDVIASEHDWTWLQRVCANLKTMARPQRDKFAHAVSPEQLFDLGIAMMDEAECMEISHHPYVSTKARDGLMIAMLICCPVRIANLTEIEISRHLLFDTDHYWLSFTEDETKTSKEYKGDLPASLTSRIDWYRNNHRRRLLALGNQPATSRLWIDREGKPMSEAAIRHQVKFNTAREFGKHVWPHLFRAIAVTGLVDEAPEQIGIAPDLLGHTNDRTTRKHYILATGTRAHQAVQTTILQGRAEALRRLRNRD